MIEAKDLDWAMLPKVSVELWVVGHMHECFDNIILTIRFFSTIKHFGIHVTTKNMLFFPVEKFEWIFHHRFDSLNDIEGL